MKKFGYLLILYFLFTSVSYALTPQDQQLIQNYVNNKDYQSAEQKLITIINNNPNDLEAINYLATIYSWDNKFDLAEQHYKMVVNQDQSNLDANLGLAKVYGWQGNLGQSVTILQNILQVYPNDSEILYSLGKTLRWNHEYNQAEFYLKKGLQIKPNDFDLLLELGLLNLDMLDFQNAALIFAHLNTLYPNNPVVKKYLKTTNIELNPKINFFYAYSDNFDIDYLKNNQNKKIRQNRYNLGYEQNIFSKTDLIIKYTVGPQVGYDVILNSTDYEVYNETLNLQAKYSFTDLFDLSLGVQSIRFSNLPNSVKPLNATTTNLNPVASITKKTNNYRVDLYYYGEFFPLVRGLATQIFNSKTYGLSYFYKFNPSFDLGACFENVYYSSYNDFRQHYIGWFDTTLFPGLNFINFQYLFKFFSSPTEYYNIFTFNKPFYVADNLLINPSLVFTLNSLKDNCQSKIMLDVNYLNSDYLSFYINSYYGVESLRTKVIPSFEFKVGLNYYLN